MPVYVRALSVTVVAPAVFLLGRYTRPSYTKSAGGGASFRELTPASDAARADSRLGLVGSARRD